ncbi:MAG TPA: flagellar export protein FliJ [Nitrosomonas sp.]|nr:flagellar export protein FliJ [Nitrosomonas sp.]HNP26173.1 flagellar export protein FliJ [Nitrosomonas sp.]
MPDTSTLRKLLDLTQKQSEDSTRKLGKLNFQHREAEKKLNLLLQYRQSYQNRLQNASQNGINHVEWQNFIRFVDKLDTAISEQRLAVKHAENNRNTGSSEYQSCQRRLNSYDTLSQRYQKTEQLIQTKAEQKELDEFISNRFTQNNSNKEK